MYLRALDSLVVLGCLSGPAATRLTSQYDRQLATGQLATESRLRRVLHLVSRLYEFIIWFGRDANFLAQLNFWLLLAYASTYDSNCFVPNNRSLLHYKAMETRGAAGKKQLGLRSLWRFRKRADPGEQPLVPKTSIFPKPSDGQENKAQTPKDVSICVAIDTSGSTYGEGLRDEVEFLLGIDDMLSPQNRTPITVLPWSDCVDKSVTLVRGSKERPDLISRGGTNPAVLYSSVLSLKALSSSKLWFLLTDGKIHKGFVQDFAMKTA